MHFSKLAATASLVGLVAAADTYIMQIAINGRGSIDLVQAETRSAGGSALIIQAGSADKTKPDVFEWTTAEKGLKGERKGKLEWLNPAASERLGFPAAPKAAASLVANNLLYKILTFNLSQGGAQHNPEEPVQFLLSQREGTLTSSDYPFTLNINGLGFIYCKGGDWGALAVKPIHDYLPGDCARANVYLKEYNAPSDPPHIPDVDVGSLDD